MTVLKSLGRTNPNKNSLESPLWTRQEDELILVAIKNELDDAAIEEKMNAAGFFRTPTALRRRISLLKKAKRLLASEQMGQHFSDGLRWSNVRNAVGLEIDDKQLGRVIAKRYGFPNTNRTKISEQLLIYIGLHEIKKTIWSMHHTRATN